MCTLVPSLHVRLYAHKTCSVMVGSFVRLSDPLLFLARIRPFFSFFFLKKTTINQNIEFTHLQSYSKNFGKNICSNFYELIFLFSSLFGDPSFKINYLFYFTFFYFNEWNDIYIRLRIHFIVNLINEEENRSIGMDSFVRGKFFCNRVQRV